MNKNREAGYYWVKTRRTKVWMIARWWPSLNKGKGFWDTMATIENDTRGGFSEIDENRIERLEKVKEDIQDKMSVKLYLRGDKLSTMPKRVRKNKPIIKRVRTK